MAQVRKTHDPNLWFNPGNWRDDAGGTVLSILTALPGGGAVDLVVNGVRGQWCRFRGAAPSLALRASTPAILGQWKAITTEDWVEVTSKTTLAADVGIAAPVPDAGVTTPTAIARTDLDAVVRPIAGVLAPAASGDHLAYACDIGTTRISRKTGLNNFGWARTNLTRPAGYEGSRDIDRLVGSVLDDMRCGCNVALGFEAPLFVPVPTLSGDLSRRRQGEGGMPWSAPAGAAVTTLGIHQSAWILGRLADEGRKLGYTFTTDHARWTNGGDRLLLCWEAFVSGPAHSPGNHPIEDAVTAVAEFSRHALRLGQANAVTADRRLSLIHAAALWAGWTDHVSTLSDASLVLKPAQRFVTSFVEV